MLSFFLVFGLLRLWQPTFLSLATTFAVDIPQVGRPTEDFYLAAGSQVRVTMTVEPSEVRLGESLILTLAMHEIINPTDVRRPDLDALEAFRVRFQIEDLPDEGSEPEARTFRYRLRPRSVEVTEVPAFVMSFFDPNRQTQTNIARAWFLTTYARAIPILVLPEAEPEPTPVVPLKVPPFAETLATTEEVLRAPSREWGWPWWVGIGFGVPLAGWGWLWLWGRLNPNAARLIRLARGRAARHALLSLERLTRLPDQDLPRAVAQTMLRYLRHRFDLPGSVCTPAEIEGQLVGVTDRSSAIRSLLADCDTARFAPSRAGEASALIEQARRLILELEEAE